ncbi:MAG: class I SAM-dependent methyltransferase [Candidatus Nomurabacteria bacterium]
MLEAQPITPAIVKDLESNETGTDRFEKISTDYSALVLEVFDEQGMDYNQLGRAVLESVSQVEPNFRKLPILDIGVGDGATSADFVQAGCTKLTGIDLNQEMVDATKVRFGDSVRLFKMNAVDMSLFSEGDFEIIISGAAIHNIPTVDRKKFWKELLRLNPRIFVIMDKIKDPNPEKHKADYDKEIASFRKVYGERHNLKEAEAEWVSHYELDDKEALDLKEIAENIGDAYEISVTFEMGLYKTVTAKRKTK